MPTPKYNFTVSNGQLLVALDNSVPDFTNSEVLEYRAASVDFSNPISPQETRKIILYNFGVYRKEFIFENFKTIGGAVPTNISNAYDLLKALIPSPAGNGSGTLNTAFTEETYSSTMSIPYNPEQPNFEITLAGNLNLTVTGTVNGDSGMVNIYSSASETIVVNGLKGLSLIGDGSSQMIPIYFIHSTDGIRWYDGRESTGSLVDTSNLAESVGTTLWHDYVGSSTGTVTSSGTSWTGTGTALTNEMIGAKIFIGSESLIISTLNTGAQTFTTSTALSSDVTNSAFEIKFKAYKINSDGTQEIFNAENGNRNAYYELSGNIKIQNTDFSPNGNLQNSAFYSRFGHHNFQSGYHYVTEIYTVATLPTPSSSVVAYATVTDALTPVYMATVVGGGTVVTPVFWNKSSWVCH